MLCNNNFHISHSDTYYGIEFIKILQPFQKLKNFYGYKKHKDEISKHYSFDISWEKINEVEDNLVDNIRSKNDINSKFKSIEYLFDKYFVNNHLFIVPTENYSFIEYNTKTLRVEKHIIHNKIINVNYNIDETCYSDMKITYNNYKIIKKFENNLNPIYKYCLPEDISFFNYIYCEYGNYDTGNSKIYALSDKYIYYIYIQK
jgi:hypothetical protein